MESMFRIFEQYKFQPQLARHISDWFSFLGSNTWFLGWIRLLRQRTRSIIARIRNRQRKTGGRSIFSSQSHFTFHIASHISRHREAAPKQSPAQFWSRLFNIISSLNPSSFCKFHYHESINGRYDLLYWVTKMRQNMSIQIIFFLGGKQWTHEFDQLCVAIEAQRIWIVVESIIWSWWNHTIICRMSKWAQRSRSISDKQRRRRTFLSINSFVQ